MSKFKLRYNLAFVLLIVVTLVLAAQPTSTQAAGFADSSFKRVWSSTDQAVAEGRAGRPWLWGPDSFTTRTEEYAETPGGQRLVQYFDKSRMEITRPGGNSNDPFYVTNGLLTKELVSGKLQLGDSRFENRAPANVAVAGDPDNVGPTYAQFASVTSLESDKRADSKVGSAVNATVSQQGAFGNSNAFDKYGVTIATYNNELGHNIPNVFINWMNGLPTNWVFAMGFPISEAYWSQVKVGGKTQDVLIQLYERRILTYNPANGGAFQVEMGNIGRHYYTWRYGNAPEQLDNEEQQLFDQINAERVAQGMPAVRVDPTLTAISRARSQDMAQNNYFSHYAPNGATYIDTLNNYRINWMACGEILAKNNASGPQVATTAFNSFLKSPTHADIIHTATFTTAGVGHSVDSKGYHILTVIFVQNKY